MPDNIPPDVKADEDECAAAEKRMRAMSAPPRERNCKTCYYMETVRLPKQIQAQMICRFMPPAMIGVQNGPNIQAMPTPTFVQDGIYCYQYLHPDDVGK